MADKIKKETAPAKEDNLVEITLPLLDDPNAIQQEFYSLNLDNVMIQRGKPVMVKKGIAELINNSEAAKFSGMRYAMEKKLRVPEEH